MGVSTDGQICYGIAFEEDFEFPWSGEGDIEEWWLRASGWRWGREQPFGPDGNYAAGYGPNDPRVEAYFVSRSSWLREHPLPIYLLNYCSDGCPMFMLAVSSTVLRALRGDPTIFSPSDLIISVADREQLLEFCGRYGIEHGEPAWYLSSYWG